MILHRAISLRLLSATLLLGALALPPAMAQPPFALTDSGPQATDFRARFLASYGVNSEIEPSFRPEDRVLYESILPFLTEDPQRAITEVERALRADANPAFHFLLGNLHYELGNFEQAEKELKTAISEFPDFRRAHRTLGLIQIQQSRFEEAIASWLKVITLGGGDAQSYGLLGYAYLSEKKYQSALGAYRMARVFKPDSLDFRRGEAQCLVQTGDFRQASALLDELIAEHPETGDFWLLQANICLQSERYDEAIYNLELAQSLGVASLESRFMLGDLHLREGNLRLALQHYKAALGATDFEARHISRAMQALQHLADRGLVDDARQFLSVLKPVLPATLALRDAERLAFAEARIQLDSGATQDALQQLQGILEHNPLHGDALILLASIYQQAEDLPQALFYLERALALPDHKVNALLALGRLEVSRQNWQAALNHLRTAQQLSPSPSTQRYIESIERIGK